MFNEDKETRLSGNVYSYQRPPRIIKNEIGSVPEFQYVTRVRKDFTCESIVCEHEMGQT